VGLEDYAIWQLNFGSSYPAADGNGNGVVDAADYVLWRNNLPPPGNGASVPEPASAVMLMIATAALGWRRRSLG